MTAAAFDLDAIEPLRRSANAAWLSAQRRIPPAGWSTSRVNVDAVVRAFPPLRVRDTFTLHAYQFRDGYDGNGVVWALPATLAFPAPDECPAGDPPRPVDALDDVMDAIEGDRTPLSYLCASLLARELAELGAFGHGVRWQAYELLDRSPWTSGSPLQTATPRDGWHAFEDEPTDWRPTVVMEGGSVSVRFHTYCTLGTEQLSRHEDRYTPARYSFTTTEAVIAEGAAGTTW